MATPSIAQGLAALSHGDHCCLLFESLEEQARITAPFLAIGLEREERCVFVADDRTVEAVREELQGVGVDGPKEERSGRLLLTSERDYLDGDRWRTEKMLGFLQSAYDSALADGSAGLRVAGDVSWQVGPRREFQEVVHYEALLDLFFIGKRLVGMCQYPRHDCPDETLSGILEAHRVAAVDSALCANHLYLPPELLVEKDPELRHRRRVEWMTSQLLRTRRAEEERDALQEQLLHSQRMEAVGRLAGGIAHDLNNVLTCVLGFSGLVLDHAGVDDEVKRDVEQIRLAGERAAALTRRLLAFGRRQVPQERVIDLNRTVEGMEEFLRPLLGNAVEFRTRLSPGLGNVKADPGELEQVLMNLILNARDAMPDGGTLTVETADVDPDDHRAEALPGVAAGPHVLLAVGDTGHGMDEETRTRIFEPFFTTKDADRGTGLGLSTVQGIVQQSGGSLSVSSEPGRGSVFEVYLPRVSEVAEEPPGPAPTSDSLRGTETLLVVDDDEAVRRFLQRVLSARGYTVLEASGTVEALGACERHPGAIQLMLTDAVLPGMNGRELAARVRGRQPEMKVVFMSGVTDDTVLQQGLLDQDSILIEKPFTPGGILREIREALDG